MLSIVTSTIAGAHKVGHSNIPTLAALFDAESGRKSWLGLFLSRGSRLPQRDRDTCRNLRIVAQEREVRSQGTTPGVL